MAATVAGGYVGIVTALYLFPRIDPQAPDPRALAVLEQVPHARVLELFEPGGTRYGVDLTLAPLDAPELHSVLRDATELHIVGLPPSFALGELPAIPPDQLKLRRCVMWGPWTPQQWRGAVTGAGLTLPNCERSLDAAAVGCPDPLVHDARVDATLALPWPGHLGRLQAVSRPHEAPLSVEPDGGRGAVVLIGARLPEALRDALVRELDASSVQGITVQCVDEAQLEADARPAVRRHAALWIAAGCDASRVLFEAERDATALNVGVVSVQLAASEPATTSRAGGAVVSDALRDSQARRVATIDTEPHHAHAATSIPTVVERVRAAVQGALAAYAANPTALTGAPHKQPDADPVVHAG